MVASAIKLAQWHTWLHGFVCHTNQIKVIMLTLNQESNQRCQVCHMKNFTRAAGCRPLFQVRYKTLPQLLILMGHGIKKKSYWRVCCCHRLKTYCVINIINVTFNNKSNFTQLVNLRSRWKLKKFQCPVTKVKEIMVFNWSLKRLRHFMSI